MEKTYMAAGLYDYVQGKRKTEVSGMGSLPPSWCTMAEHRRLPALWWLGDNGWQLFDSSFQLRR